MKLKLNSSNLSENLRRLRNKHNLTQDQVVARMQLEGSQMSRSTYSKIETDNYSSIPFSDLEIITKIYNVSFNDLLEKHS